MMNMNSNEYLLEQLELAETKEERHQAIVNILQERPELKILMQKLMTMEQAERDDAVTVLTECMKPHTVSM